MSWDAGKRADMGKWNDLAAKELRDKPVDDLVWRSAEGIEIKPVYTAEDLENLEYVDSTPGLPRRRTVRSGPSGRRPRPPPRSL